MFQSVYEINLGSALRAVPRTCPWDEALRSRPPGPLALPRWPCALRLRPHCVAIEAPALPCLARQLHTVEQPQQLVGGVREVVLAGFPVMYSPSRHMKKLRTGVQIHAQIPVHGAEATGKLEAGITVVTPDTEPLFN